MKYFTIKKSVYICIVMLIMSSFTVSSQNLYLSFKDGSKVKGESMETTPKRTYQSLKSNDLEIGYAFTGAYVANAKVKNDSYNFLHINGFAKMNQVGAPALPSHNDIVAMPRGAEGKIIILEAEYTEFDGYMIHPALEPPRDTEGALPPLFKKDEKVYSQDEFFPKNVVEITNVALNRGTGMATVQICPVQFNPVTGKIRAYTNIKYRFEMSGGEKSFEYIAQENTLHYTNLLKQNVINSASIPDGFSSENQKKNKSEAKNYIIVTHSQFLSQAKELAKWKRQLGYTVEVVSKSSWTAKEVKAEIHNRYDSWTPKPDYFVIIGDHTGSYAVPGEIHQDPSDGEDFATDLYVACMDGETDHFPDMAHGRISVSTIAEAEVVINKIVNYEKSPTTNSDYYTNILNCAQWQDTDDNDGYADRRFCHTSEEIRDYLQDNHAYTSTRVYYRETGTGTADVASLRYNNGYYSDGQLLPAELRDASFNWSGGSTEITTAIDAGKFMVFHRDHGYVGGSGWAHPYYTTSSMTSLNNGELLPVVFSMNCHTGEFQLDNCFAEKFLRMENKGAVGVVGAAYYSYSGYNDALSVGMIDAIWSDPGLYPDFGTAGTGGTYTNGAGNEIYTMGDVVNQGLHAMVQNFGDNIYTYQLFHYFGDPAMKIWTSNPNTNTITATHASEISCSGNTFSVTGSTPNAVATLVINNNLLASVVLDGSGNGTLNYTMDESAATVTLTISKHNQKPYVTNITVTGTCSYSPSLETYTVSDLTFESAVLHGEITSNNNDAVTESGFVYSKTTDPVIGGTGVTKVTTNPLVSDGEFSESISSLDFTTEYFYKSYAMNANGTGYGDELSFTTFCQPPSTQASGLSIDNMNDHDITISWTSGGDYVLVVAKEGEAVSEDPIGGESYSANADFTLGEDILDDNIVVYNGTSETLTITNLNSGTDYYFAVYKYATSDNCYNIVSPATGNATTTGYCQASSENGVVYINSLTLGDISNLNTSVSSSNYADYTAYTTDLEQGITYTLTIENGYVNEGDDLSVWIDFNDNGSFEDAGENVICEIDAWTDNDFDLIIPADAPVGNHTMRVRTQYWASDCNTSCGETMYGEVEDYTVNIVTGVPTSYCEAAGGGVISLQDVIFGDISNLSTGDNGYEDFTALSTDVEIGETYILSIINTYPAENTDLAVWIDFNDNYSFDDAGEKVICAAESTGNGDFEITIPGTAELGSHRMRIRTKYQGADCGEPCGTTTYGEVEDYTVNVIASDLPAVETSAYSNITKTSATVTGEVTYEGSSSVSEKGVVWNTTGNPTLSDNKLASTETGLGSYDVSITGLSENTTYYIRTYAKNASGERYGNELSFTTTFDIELTQVYTLGKLPVAHAIPHTISALIINRGYIDASNIDVSLSITGDNIFMNTQNISSLSAGDSITVFFAGYNPSLEGDQEVEVSIPDDDNMANNVMTKNITTTLNSYSYSQGTVVNGGVGFNGSSGDFVAKFNTSEVGKLNQVDVIFTNGGKDFQIGIWDATGANGAPGTLLFTSETQVSTSGEYTLLLDPGVSIPAGDFYVGVRQMGDVNIGFAYQREEPIRTNTFYYTSPTGDTEWTDFAPGASFRFMIEPKFAVSNDVAVSDAYSTTGIVNQAMDIDVEIINYGTNSQSDIPVYYKVDGGTEIGPLSIAGPVAENETATGTFTGSLAFTPSMEGTYSVEVYTKLANDQVNENNSTTFTIDVYKPEITVSATSLDFGNIQTGTNSASQNYTLGGTNLIDDITITAPAGFEISLDDADFSVNPITLSPVSGSVSSTTIYVRFAPGADGSYSLNLTHESSEADQVNIELIGNGVTPTILTSITEMDFGSVETGTSVVQTYTVEGVYLTNDITLTASADFEISLDNSDFSVNPIILTQTAGTVSETTIYVRFSPATEQAYAGTLEHTSTDAAQLDIAINGNGVAPGTPIITKSVSGFNFGDLVLNTTSVEKLYTISGSNLSSDIVITAPSNVDISTTSGSGFTNTLTLTQSGGTVSNTTIYVRFTPTVSGEYSDNITHESAGATTANITVVGNGICDDIVISSLPDTYSKCSGETIDLSVVATGTDMMMQWYKDDVALVNGGDISGVTTLNLLIDNATSDDEGIYYFEATDACGNTGSSNETEFILYANTEIITQPESETVCDGDDVEFNIVAEGTALTYQWQKDGVDITGENSTSLILTDVSNTDEGEYTCVVDGTCGDPVTSNIVTLTVNETAVAITTQPQDTEVCEGTSAEFTVDATSATAYQWLKDGASISGAESDSYTIALVSSSDEGNYSCLVFDDCGFVLSGSATLTMNTSTVAITSQPESAEVCEGSTATFSITASNASSYQWQKDGADISGATASTYTINSAKSENEGDYACIAFDACGNVRSNTASLTINTATQILTQPADVNAEVGDDVTFNVEAEGTNLVYQWRFNGSDISGATSDSYQILSVVENNAGEYTVFVSGTCGDITSNSANMSVTTGIDDLDIFGINVYPNPSEGIFNISYGQLNDAVDVVIYSLDGKIVYQEKHHAELNKVDISDKAKGMYIIRFNIEGKSIISNIILK